MTDAQPKQFGSTYLWDEDHNRYRFRYYAPLELHPYYQELVEEHKDELLREVQGNGIGVDVTEKFRKRAKTLYRESGY